MNMSQYIKMQMVDDNGGNHVRKNDVQNDGNEVGQNAVHNLGIQNVENMNGLSGVLEIANQYGNGNVVTAPTEGNGNGINSNPIRVNNTAKTRRPHLRSNSNTDRVPSKSKSSCLLNNIEKIEETHRKFPIPTNQKAHANAKNSKELGSKGSLASSRPSKPRTCLRWIPTGRIFAMCGKLTASSNTENKSEKSVCDNASTSNPPKPSCKRSPISTSLIGSQNRRDLPRNTPLDRVEVLGKEIVDIAAQISSANIIVLGMFNLDLVPLALRLLQNREAHINYLKYTQEQPDILRGIVEQANAKQPLDNALDFACSIKKAKIVESKNANHSEPNHTWGSNATDIPSSFSLVMTGCLDCSLVSGLQVFETNDREPLSAHDLFSRFLEGVDLLSGSRDINLYTISLEDMLKTSLICLLSKASKTKSWLWHCRLSHLNFACALGKSKKSSHQPKAEDTNQEKLYLLHMDLCVPMRVASINGKSVVERRNQTLVEAARTMLIFSKAPLFLWSEAINTACYTQNRLLIRIRYNKTPYELMQDKKLDLSFFHVFGALCYPTNNNDNLSKLDAKADIGIFIGYAPAKKAFRFYNKRTWKIIETIHVTFDELTAMASEQFSLGPGLHSMTPATSSSGLVSNPVSQQPFQEAVVPRVVVLANSLVSTSID
ncbi:integrase, catalytic region, zinc finger, CCHC-type containing protein [Tanacetum coccineum]